MNDGTISLIEMYKCIPCILQICELLGKYKKRALAVFSVVLEAASFLLDIYGKSKRRILLAAFLLSAFSFAISMYTCIMRRTGAATGVHWQKQLVWMVEISLCRPVGCYAC